MLVKAIDAVKSPEEEEEKKDEESAPVVDDQIQIDFSNLAMGKFVEHNQIVDS